MLTLLYYAVYFSCFSSLMLDMISRASDRALRVLWCTGFQTSCVWTSQPAQSSWQPCANTGAVWTNTPLVRGGRVHRTLQWATHTTQTTLQTHGDTQKLIDEPLSHKKTHSSAAWIQVLLHKLGTLPIYKTHNPYLDKAQVSVSIRAAEDLTSAVSQSASECNVSTQRKFNFTCQRFQAMASSCILDKTDKKVHCGVWCKPCGADLQWSQ